MGHDRDLTDEEFAVLSRPEVLEAMAIRAEALTKQGMSREDAMQMAMDEAELEMKKQVAARATSPKLGFSSKLGDMLQAKKKR